MDNRIRLASIFCSGMVLQRGEINKLWGYEPHEDTVYAELDGKSCSAPVRDGKFCLELEPHEAASGLTLTVRGSGEVVIEDICFGELFLLSGQSNMQLPVGRVLDAHGEEIAQADYPLIRQFTVEPRCILDAPVEDVPAQPAVKAAVVSDAQSDTEAPTGWFRAQGEEVMLFSAAGFFFARKLHQKLGVPIGLVLNAQGGSTVEAWLPKKSLEGLYTPNRPLPQNDSELTERVKREDAAFSAWCRETDTGRAEQLCASIPPEAETITVPFFSPGTALEGFSGSVWFYREVELENEPQQDSLLYIGELIDSDTTYVNGKAVGATAYQYPPRRYGLACDVLKKGKNLIAVRLVANNAFSAFLPEHPYFLRSGSERVSLEGEWRMYIEKRMPAQAPEVLFPPILPTGLYNASLAPVAGMSYRAVLWYQGESSSDRDDTTEAYTRSMQVMVSDWRELMGRCVPFICVAMADYQPPRGECSPNWKRVQEQQLALPEHIELLRTVSAIDLSEPYELHPQLKGILGERLADEALSFIFKL